MLDLKRPPPEPRSPAGAAVSYQQLTEAYGSPMPSQEKRVGGPRGPKPGKRVEIRLAG
jgi:hypothetical protein